MLKEVDIVYILYAIIVAFNFFLGTSILLDNPQKETNRSFFFVILVGMGWVISLYYYYIITDSQLILVVGRANFAFAALSMYAMYNFIRNFISIPFSRIQSFFILETILLTFITIVTPFISAQELIVGSARVTEFGALYFLYLVHMVFYLSYAIGLLIRRIYRNRKERVDKVGNGIKYLAAGVFITFFIVIITNVILPFFFNYSNLQNYAPLYTVILFGLSAYAIGKHHLFNLKVISTEIFTYILWFFVFIRFLVATEIVDIWLNLGLLILVIVVGMLLMRSVVREVEQREKIEKLATDLQKANTHLTELDRQKSEFVSFATHQLRAPLTAMKGYASLLLEGDMGELAAAAREGVSRIFESTKTLVHIVDDYLNISRIELGSMKYMFEPVNFKSMVEDVIAEMKPLIDKTGLKFSFAAETAATDYVISADRDKLKQVIANVVDNSMKYTPQGSVAVSLAYDPKRRMIIFMVKDTGVGIPPEMLPQLFQKFSRADNANKVNIRGTGLGLFVAKQMIEAHHGTIHAESPGEGKGSSFIVELPLQSDLHST